MQLPPSLLTVIASYGIAALAGVPQPDVHVDNPFHHPRPSNVTPVPGAIYRLADNELLHLASTAPISDVSRVDSKRKPDEEICAKEFHKCKKQNRTWWWTCTRKNSTNKVTCTLCSAIGLNGKGKPLCMEDWVKAPGCVDFVYCENWYTCVGCSKKRD